MESQQIIIYSGLGLLLAIGITVLILSILILKNIKALKSQPFQKAAPKPAAPAETGIVFCRNCGSEYNSIEPICPNCKTPR